MTPLYEIKNKFDKKETSFGCGYEIFLELHLRVVITFSSGYRCDFPQYVLALVDTFTHIVTKVGINSLINVNVVQAEKRKDYFMPTKVKW